MVMFGDNSGMMGRLETKKVYTFIPIFQDTEKLSNTYHRTSQIWVNRKGKQ